MLYVDLPGGGRHGWGVVGDNLADALARRTIVHRLSDEELGARPVLAGPLLQAVTRPHLRPRRSPAGYGRHIGYSVFERDLEARQAASSVRDTYETLVTASRWAEQTLREGGLTNVKTIHHGVDTRRFHGGGCTSRRTSDDFVVFSGGKLELRKGQDIVIQAFRVLAERHRDVRLVIAWHNPWARRGAPMAASPYHPLAEPWDGSSVDVIGRWLVAARVPIDAVTFIPALPNEAMASVYLASDVGLFPNRCEGSTNLVLMEYMACGRPVIATDFSGHRDVLTEDNSVPLRQWQLRPVLENDRAIACWCEPDIDEAIEALEQAYHDRDHLAALGLQAASDMSAWTWDRAAGAFLELL